MPVLPRVTVSAALNLRERGGRAKGRRAKAALRNQAAPTAAQAGRWVNSRRFMGPPFGDRGGGLSIIWTSGSEVRLSRGNCEWWPGIPPERAAIHGSLFWLDILPLRG